jgi:hypothetical protein|tara:strand:+ start:11024 stop:11248 length:225 start_codon:yes stop_codon:yes gene_type:complete
MKEAITLVKGWVNEITHLMMSFVAVGAMSEIIFGTGIFGVNVIGNLTTIINKFGQSGFSGLVALLLLVGIYNRK